MPCAKSAKEAGLELDVLVSKAVAAPEFFMLLRLLRESRVSYLVKM